MCTVDYWYSTTCVSASTICLRSTKSSLPNPSLHPYVTHVMNYSRPSTAFPYCKRWKAEQDLEWGYFFGSPSWTMAWISSSSYEYVQACYEYLLIGNHKTHKWIEQQPGIKASASTTLRTELLKEFLHLFFFFQNLNFLEGLFGGLIMHVAVMEVPPCLGIHFPPTMTLHTIAPSPHTITHSPFISTLTPSHTLKSPSHKNRWLK